MTCVWGAVGARKPSPRSSTQDFIRNRLVVIPLLRGPELAIADSTAPLTLTPPVTQFQSFRSVRLGT